jgi:hypothetical protein
VKHNKIALELTETGVNDKTTPDNETGFAFRINSVKEPTRKVTSKPDHEVLIVPPLPQKSKDNSESFEKEREMHAESVFGSAVNRRDESLSIKASAPETERQRTNIGSLNARVFL